MEEERILFSVTTQGEGSAVALDVDGAEDIFAVALGIYQALSECHQLGFMLAGIVAMKRDKGFQEKLETNCVDLTVFNDILKNKD